MRRVVDGDPKAYGLGLRWSDASCSYCIINYRWVGCLCGQRYDMNSRFVAYISGKLLRKDVTIPLVHMTHPIDQLKTEPNLET